MNNLNELGNLILTTHNSITNSYNTYIKQYIKQYISGEKSETNDISGEINDEINDEINKSCEISSINTKLKHPHNKKKYRKKQIPKALREQVWIAKMGRKFDGQCMISWCTNEITCFYFDCGHNIPESKGGPTNVENLIPICRNCNLGMGNRLTIEEWQKKYETPKKWYQFW
jgi:5-methylcytosine-specific restriction endonuclease McrA